MRRIDYIDWQEKRKSAGALTFAARAGFVRMPSSRPRDLEERKLLLKMDRERLEEWAKTGRLRRLGPRSYRFDPKMPERA